MNKRMYNVEMEVAGEFGLFARPDTGSNPSSFPIPTISAAKGMFESVFFMKTAVVIPISCKICSPIRECDMPYNSRSHLSKPDLIKKGLATRINETNLFQPIFQLTATVLPSGLRPINPASYSSNYAHAYQEQFNRHLKKGTFRNSVHLGHRHMTASYCGPFRAETKVQTNINMVVRDVIVTMFERLVDGVEVDPCFKNVQVVNGVATYLTPEDIFDLMNARCEKIN